MIANINISICQPEQYFETEKLTRSAFWNVYKPGCDEHLILNQLRLSKDYIPQLDLVAIKEDEIMGHIIATKAIVKSKDDKEKIVLCAGPFSVNNKMQKQGVGRILMDKLIKKAKELNYPAIILYGHPEYYEKFGFVNAANFEITTQTGENFDAFMALVLNKELLKNIKGKFIYSYAFNVNHEKLVEFDKKFLS